MKPYKLTYKFFITEEEAKAFCERENATGTNYKKQNKIAKFTEWTNENKTEHYFLAWYFEK